MADNGTPHFHNDPGAPVIHVGAKEFKCIGARPPFDHPHIFLDMGKDSEIVCPYCSTLYKYNSQYAHGHTNPPDCAYIVQELETEEAVSPFVA